MLYFLWSLLQFGLVRHIRIGGFIYLKFWDHLYWQGSCILSISVLLHRLFGGGQLFINLLSRVPHPRRCFSFWNIMVIFWHLHVFLLCISDILKMKIIKKGDNFSLFINFTAANKPILPSSLLTCDIVVSQ